MQQITEEHRRIIIIIICTTKNETRTHRKVFGQAPHGWWKQTLGIWVICGAKSCSRRQDKKLVAKYGM